MFKNSEKMLLFFSAQACMNVFNFQWNKKLLFSLWGAKNNILAKGGVLKKFFPVSQLKIGAA